MGKTKTRWTQEHRDKMWEIIREKDRKKARDRYNKERRDNNRKKREHILEDKRIETELGKEEAMKEKIKRNKIA